MNHQGTPNLSDSKESACKLMVAVVPEAGRIPCGKRGYTLLELLLVVAIIGILAIVAVPAYSDLKNLAKEALCKNEIRNLERSISAYYIDNGNVYPAHLSDIQGIGTPIDPWGNAYVYSPAPNYMDITGITTLNGEYDLYSMGKDSASAHTLTNANCSDDIIRAGDGSYVGIGKNY